MYALEADYENQLDVLQINIDEGENSAEMARYGYRGTTPHLLLFDGQGNVVRQWFGVFTREQVEPILMQTLVN
ncbi:MAG: hypothetical protein ACPG8W_19300 [Candidatus Promineifilaceae bacterium]